MPVYEYRCGGGHHYEKTEGFDAPREHSCPTCGSTARRQISIPAVIFKGSGFYSTDNRRHSDSNGRSSDTAPATASSDSAGSSSSESAASNVEAKASE